MKEPGDIVGRLEQLRGFIQHMDRRLQRVESQVSALVRMSMIREAAPDPLTDIDRRRFAYSSQHDEDGLLYALFNYVGVNHRWFVEIGCGGNGGNSGFLARECGWTGLMVDADKRAVKKTAVRYHGMRVRFGTLRVTSNNAAELFAQFNVPDEPDLLSVDIDSTDYWVLEAVTANYRPRVIIAEYNSIFGSSAAVTIPNVEDFVRAGKGPHHFYFGASLAALTRLAARRGYRLVMTDPTGTNAVFIRNDLAPDIPAADLGTAFRYYSRHRIEADAVGGDVAAHFRTIGLTLVDV